MSLRNNSSQRTRSNAPPRLGHKREIAAIRDACAAAKATTNRAARYIKAGMSLKEVRADLFDVLRARDPHEIDSRSSTGSMLAKTINSTVDRWVRTDRTYQRISDPNERKKTLDVLLSAQEVATGLYPLIDRDGRFAIDGSLLALRTWVREIKADGGRTPQLPEGACANELAYWFKAFTGRPQWKIIGRIVSKRFSEILPPLREIRQSERGKAIVDSTKKGLYTLDEARLGEWAKELVEREKKWWTQFKTRTWIGTPEDFLNLQPTSKEAESHRAFRGRLVIRNSRRIKSQKRAKETQLWTKRNP